MLTRSFFYDPQIDFEYICDKELWKNIFLNPVPYDWENPNSIKINLSLFIEFKEFNLETSFGVKTSKLISFKNSYYTSSEDMKSLIFITLSNFLKRFNRPFLHCYVDVPNHSSIPKIDKYSPIELEGKIPQFPKMNSTKDAFCLKFKESLYYDLYMYAFGEEFPRGTVFQYPFTLFFSFSCICGFILKL